MERMRGAARQHGDVPCGGMPDAYEIMRVFKEKGWTPYSMHRYDLMSFQRLLIHMYDIDGGRMRPDNNDDNLEIRVKYLTNELDEAGFKRALQIKEKATQKKRELYQVISTVYEVAAEAFRGMLRVDDANNILNLIKELQGLMTFAQESADTIAKKYNSVPYRFPVLESNM
jgi:hypothetical protein